MVFIIGQQTPLCQQKREDSDGEATPTAGQRRANDPMDDLMEAAKKLNMRVQLSPAPGQRSEEVNPRGDPPVASSRPQSSRSSSGNRRQKARAPTAPVQQLRQESRPQSRAGSGSRGGEQPVRVRERVGGPLMSPQPKPGSQEDPATQEGATVPPGLDSPVKLRQVTATGPMVLVRPKSGSRERGARPKSAVSQSHHESPVQETGPKAIVPKNPFGGVVVVAEDSTTEEEEGEEDDLAVRERQAPTQMWSRRRSYAASVQQGRRTI